MITIVIDFNCFKFSHVRVITIDAKEYRGRVVDVDNDFVYLIRDYSKFLSRFRKDEIAYIDKTFDNIDSDNVFLNVKQELSKFIGGRINITVSINDKEVRYEYCKLIDVMNNGILFFRRKKYKDYYLDDAVLVQADYDSIVSWEPVNSD